ncbi:hypothetical protein [Alicyclobacillus macrosporangiidus]|uniref:hypothetical protein n=1 Tax=Alicyclobacillus macrosporangiidus TaxID=392015 RepID=UPI0012DD9592|nr:hypothetical protein [Alicyclobacillus macrosporangiidus]
MAYTPNIWLMNDLERRIVQAAKQFSGYTLLLRPTRRHVFVRNYRLNMQLPEFFKPCFGVLAKQNDPDKKPCMVIETEYIPQALHDLYNQHGILWVRISQDNNEYVLQCSHGGTTMGIREQTGSLFKLLAAPLSWHERNVSFAQGSFVHSHSERVLRESIQVLSPSYRIEVHHQVPVSWVLGYKPDLSPEERRLLGHEIDAVITQSFEADPDCAVILPVKLDIYDSHREDGEVAEKDQAVRNLCSRYQVPLLTISPGGSGGFEFDCPVLGLPKGYAENQEPNEWAAALSPFLGRAIQWANRGF